MAVASETFSGIQTAVSAVHLMLDGVEIISLATIGPIVQEARRMFEKGEWRKSALNFSRAVAAFEQSTGQWRQQMNAALAIARRQSLTPIAERKKGRGGSIAEIAKLSAEKTRVDTQIAAAARLLQRLKVDLEALTVAQEGQLAQDKAESLPGRDPSSIAASDSTARANIDALMQRGLEKETELRVTTNQGGARFSPSFPFGRLVLFEDSGEVVRIRRVPVQEVVYLRSPDEPMEEKTMPLREFVRRVRAGGVWLLRPLL
jgi:hypothetical protein